MTADLLYWEVAGNGWKICKNAEQQGQISHAPATAQARWWIPGNPAFQKNISHIFMTKPRGCPLLLGHPGTSLLSRQFRKFLSRMFQSASCACHCMSLHPGGSGLDDFAWSMGVCHRHCLRRGPTCRWIRQSCSYQCEIFLEKSSLACLETCTPSP